MLPGGHDEDLPVACELTEHQAEAPVERTEGRTPDVSEHEPCDAMTSRRAGDCLKPEENVQAPGAAVPWTPGAPAPVTARPPVKAEAAPKKPAGRKLPATRPARMKPGRKTTASKRAAAKRPEAHRPAR
jgi:hypothetical protein